MKTNIEYKTKDNMREIRIKAEKDDTSIIIFDFDKWIGSGIKLEKEVAISLASKILKFYNRNFIFSDKISKNLEKIEWKLDDSYETMVEHEFDINSEEFLDIKEYINYLIKEIK